MALDPRTALTLPDKLNVCRFASDASNPLPMMVNLDESEDISEPSSTTVGFAATIFVAFVSAVSAMNIF